MRIAGTLVLVFLLGACEAQDSPAAEAEAAAETEPASAGPKDTIDLQATGLTVPAQDGDETLSVPFGSNRAAAEATLMAVLGEVEGRSAGEDDCWLKTSDYAGISLSFNDDDQFVGWFANAPYVPEATRAEMLADAGVQLVADSTLGAEFMIGDPAGQAITGLFDGEADDASVGALWAGENCIYR